VNSYLFKYREFLKRKDSNEEIEVAVKAAEEKLKQYAADEKLKKHCAPPP
jgi:hypothetical protein